MLGLVIGTVYGYATFGSDYPGRMTGSLGDPNGAGYVLITLGLAWLTEHAGLSLALGAFVAGMLVAETEYQHQVEADIRPFQDVLLGLFFITIGMKLDWRPLVDSWWLVILLTALPILAARSGLPVGSTVIVETTGPVQGRGGVRIVERDGKPYGEELFSGDSYADDAHEGEATTIRLTTEAFTRRGAGRIPTSELRYAVDGDEDLARMLLDAIAVTP